MPLFQQHHPVDHTLHVMHEYNCFTNLILSKAVINTTGAKAKSINANKSERSSRQIQKKNLDSSSQISTECSTYPGHH